MKRPSTARTVSEGERDRTTGRWEKASTDLPFWLFLNSKRRERKKKHRKSRKIDQDYFGFYCPTRKFPSSYLGRIVEILEQNLGLALGKGGGFIGI